MTKRDRILFTDDDDAVLNALRENLQGMAGEWDMAFAHGGEEALARLREGNFSVIVSNLDNRIMDGETLMDRVRQEAPEAARVILSSRPDVARLHRVADDEHFYLRKGCSFEEFVSAIRDACELHRWMREHPRPMSTDDIKEILIDFFSNQLLRQHLTLQDVPERLRPHISREILDIVAPVASDRLDVAEPRMRDDSWVKESGWPDDI